MEERVLDLDTLIGLLQAVFYKRKSCASLLGAKKFENLSVYKRNMVNVSDASPSGNSGS